MKIRNGFVSNSSSTSFVFLGIKVDLDDTRLVNWLELKQKGISVIHANDCGYIGLYLAEGNDEYLDEREISLDELISKAHEIATKLDLSNTFDVKLHSGMVVT